jgi:hypothetical protein
MKHLVLLGDSVFDNRAYVDSGQAVVDQIKSRLPSGCKVSLLAVDGSITEQLSAQLRRLPGDATHLALSVGGNDALSCLAQLEAPTNSVKQALVVLAQIQMAFQVSYRKLILELLALNMPLLVCTIYDSIPRMPTELKTALSLFNDVIVRECLRHDLPVFDLREVLIAEEDYSVISPIEPSVLGGGKIAKNLAKFMAVPRAEK